MLRRGQTHCRLRLELFGDLTHCSRATTTSRQAVRSLGTIPSTEMGKTVARGGYQGKFRSPPLLRECIDFYQFDDDSEKLMSRLAKVFEAVDPGDGSQWKDKVVLGFWAVSSNSQ